MSGNKIPVSITINGCEHSHSVDSRLLLADFIRHRAGLTGTHIGCEHGVCGACTISIDGGTARSCLMLAVQAHGRAVTTIETPAPTRAMQVLKEEFHRAHALQCGFCTPGFLFAMEEFLSESAERSDEDIQEALNGNLCRCTGYINIFKAVRSAADRMNELAITVGDRD